MKISPFFSKDAAKPPSSSYARRVVAFGDIVSQCQSCCEGKNEEALSFQYDMKCEEQFFVNSSSFGFGSFGEHTARRTSKCSSSWSSSLSVPPRALGVLLCHLSKFLRQTRFGGPTRFRYEHGYAARTLKFLWHMKRIGTR